MQSDYIRLKADWQAGRREREDALHLLFLSWMHWADPSFVTGMDEDPDALELWPAIFDHFGDEDAQDAEFLHVAAMMAYLFPWQLGDKAEWLARAGRMRAASLQLRPEGFPQEHFEGRGDYGEYFAHQARQPPYLQVSFVERLWSWFRRP